MNEHPDQLRKQNSEQGRRPSHYVDLASIDGVTPVPVDTPVFELIDESEATVTVAGTAGWEAIVRGTPAIVFGNAWYRGCDGCFSVRTVDELCDALDRVADAAAPPDETEILRFVNQIERAGRDVYLAEYERPDDIRISENASEIAVLYRDWAEEHW